MCAQLTKTQAAKFFQTILFSESQGTNLVCRTMLLGAADVGAEPGSVVWGTLIQGGVGTNPPGRLTRLVKMAGEDGLDTAIMPSGPGLLLIAVWRKGDPGSLVSVMPTPTITGGELAKSHFDCYTCG